MILRHSAQNNESLGIKFNANLKLKMPNAPKPSPEEKP